MRPNTVRDFWKKVKRGTVAECWNWLTSKDTDGYGTFWFRNKQWRSPRFLFAIILKKSIVGKEVLHHCDNPSCVNPKHLYLGSCKDNASDREKRGRGQKGVIQSKERIAKRVASRLKNGKKWTTEMKLKISIANFGRKHTEVEKYKMSMTHRGSKNVKAKIDEDAVKRIRWYHSKGKLTSRLALDFGISCGQVRKIINKTAWRHVP